MTTSTANVAWAAGSRRDLGRLGIRRVRQTALWPPAPPTTGTVLTGLAPNTVYEITVVTVDVAGNRSPHSLPADAVTDPLDTAPLTTVLAVVPPTPDGDQAAGTSPRRR